MTSRKEMTIWHHCSIRLGRDDVSDDDEWLCKTTRRQERISFLVFSSPSMEPLTIILSSSSSSSSSSTRVFSFSLSLSPVQIFISTRLSFARQNRLLSIIQYNGQTFADLLHRFYSRLSSISIKWSLIVRRLRKMPSISIRSSSIDCHSYRCSRFVIVDCW